MRPAAPTPCPRPAPPPPRRRETIFVSVAAYCDPLLAFTLKSAVSQAADPGRVVIGVVEQQWPEARLQLGAEWAQRQLRWLRLHPLEARGPCWARALAQTLYQGEDWFFQVDSHTWFEPGWDERLVAWGRRCAALNPRSLLSCYPNPFTMVEGQPQAQVVTPQVLAHVVSEASGFAPGHPVLMFEGVPVASDAPVPGFHVGAGCLFAPGHLVQALPYDPWLYFHGEEQALALRAFSHGWDIFHVPGMPVYHQYHRAGEAPRPLHWDAAQDAQRTLRAAALTEAAQQRLDRLVRGDPALGVYGLGTARTLAEFAAFSGIDYAARDLRPSARKARYGL